jgi:hypothetical protein
MPANHKADEPLAPKHKPNPARMNQSQPRQQPAKQESSVVEPAKTEVVEPTIVEPVVTASTVVEPTVVEPTVVDPVIVADVSDETKQEVLQNGWTQEAPPLDSKSETQLRYERQRARSLRV